jgi:histone acetyltransferase (RNA polymerase elongator complex component)
LPAGPEDVVRAIEDGILQCAKTPQIAFYGGSFTAIPVEEQISLLSAAQPYLEAGKISSLRVSTRPDAIDRETLARLKNYGVTTIELGAQSMVDEVLMASGRGHKAEDTVKAAQLIKEEGFFLALQMMTGLPDSNPERDIETARRIIELEPDGVRIYPTVIIRDTQLYELWRAGEYKEHTVEDAVEVCAQILPLFQNAHIPVIRLGLNPTDDLSGGDAAGGAYHPALGELVKSRVLLNRAREMLKNAEWGRELTLAVGYSYVSQMIGQHKCNINALREEFGYEKIKVVGRDLDYGEIELLHIAK